MSTIGYYPLFCTLPQFPVELNSKLITETKDVDGEIQNCLVLVLSSDQQEFHRGLTPFSEPAASEFAGADIQHIGNLSTQLFEYFLFDNRMDKVYEDIFVIFDERTLQDNTVRVVQNDVGFVYNEDRDIISEEVVERLETVRCEISTLGWLLALLEEDGMIQVKINQEVVLGDDDVVDL
ncbi:hypothetical protein D6C98_07402 [Aureobasidium pullulans]|nr:hypothetical protein D6C98_07402 [Aureobasidium pullulans]